MKSEILHTIILLVVYLLLSSRSCEPDHPFAESPDQITKQDSLISEFRIQFDSDYLTETQLMYFSEKSKQKVAEIIDLLNIYMDPALDTTFQIHACKLLLKGFLNSKAPVSLKPINRTNEIMQLDRWIVEIKKQPYACAFYNTEDLKITEPFKPSGPEKYTGSLTGNFIVFCKSGLDTVYHDEYTRTVSLVITKNRKSFGGNIYQNVWQVFLNGIK